MDLGFLTEGFTEPLNFEGLAKLRTYLNSVQATHVATMQSYIADDQRGFCHLLSNKTEASVASSATCLASLVATGRWAELGLPEQKKAGAEPGKASVAKFHSRTEEIAQFLLGKRDSADLGEDNPFTLSFIAEGIYDLQREMPQYPQAAAHEQSLRNDILPKIADALREEWAWTADNADEEAKTAAAKSGARGAVAIFPYPPSAYLTQLAHRALKHWQASNADLDALVHAWSLNEINKQAALISGGSRAADPMQLAYALITAINSRTDAFAKPEDKELFAHALRTFFGTQRADGGWPLSRPMFHYKKVGNAYCFEYELLTQLLQCDLLRDDLLRYLPQLGRAAAVLESTKFDLDSRRERTRVGWASGHHPQLPGPESWSTASVYHFTHALNRVVAEAIRIELFRELGREYDGPPGTPLQPPRDDDLKGFAEDFLDAELRPGKSRSPLSLREQLATKFVYPIARSAQRVHDGQALPKETPMSAILFGPPGTSKTQLAGIIADYLRWPLLEVDPSYLVKEGLDKVQAMANRLFSMLEIAEEVVVLLDEFDEMGRDRTANRDLLSRFITTAMLPKLASINRERRIVFLLATNYVSDFDAAFSRRGRFDMMLQVMPPSASEKKRKWSVLQEKIDLLQGADKTSADSILDDLTFDEAKTLAARLKSLRSAKSILTALKEAEKTSTLAKVNRTIHTADSKGRAVERSYTWKQSCKQEREAIRFPDQVSVAGT